MRFLFILLFALSITLAWQTNAVADVAVAPQCIAAEEAPKEGEKKSEEDEEPECD